jgi:molybdopterin-guanine dinucleotide biosynthesis protein
VRVAGGTSTGKTTLVNALLAEVAKTGDRVALSAVTLQPTKSSDSKADFKLSSLERLRRSMPLKPGIPTSV